MIDDINTKRTELANQMAAAGAAALDFNATAAVLAAIPDTEPQQYVAAGTPENIAAILPATISPARRMRHGDRPTEALVFDEPAATSGDGPDLQQLKALALAATPGPWSATHWNGHAPTTVMRAGHTMVIAETTGFGRDSSECAPDAAFIAAANPAVVLGLIARIERTTAHVQPVNTSSERVENAAGNEQVERAASPAPQGLAKQFGYPAIASGATASGDELLPLPDFFALGKTRINGVEHGHYSASQMHAYARAAVSAATKPTADQIKDRSDAIRYRFLIEQDAATKPAAAVPAVSEELRKALQTVARWELPPTGKTWDDGSPMSYAACFGSNGERDYMRQVALNALAATPAASTIGAAQTADQVPQTTHQPEKCWSRDEENFSYQSLEDLLDTHDELKPGDTVWVADAVRPDMNRLIDADDVTQTMGERAYDIAGEHAEDYPDVSKEAEDELNALLAGWISKNCAPTFWGVENVRAYVLSDDDCQAATQTTEGAGNV